MNESLFTFRAEENRACLMGWDISISAEEGVNKRIGNTSSSPFTESVRTKSLRLGVLTDVLAAKDVFLRNLVHYRPS